MSQHSGAMDRHISTPQEEISAGGVVFDRGEALVVQHLRGDWVMPKGHLEAGESPEDAAIREVKEETNLTVKILARIGQTEYDFRTAGDGQWRHKIVHWFLMRLDGDRDELRAVAEEGMAQARWLGIDEACEQLTFEADRAILRQGWQILEEQGLRS
ncbi:MAG: NUDIX hydrolase [Syntrophothermus sp.]